MRSARALAARPRVCSSSLPPNAAVDNIAALRQHPRGMAGILPRQVVAFIDRFLPRRSSASRLPLLHIKMRLGDVERGTADALEPELRRHEELTLRAFDAIGLVLEGASEVLSRQVSPSRAVTTMLLVRLANDLRGAALLALRGYPLQAATLVGSMFEAAYTAAYIGGDDTLAQEWINHVDPTTCFRGIGQLIRDVIATMPMREVEREPVMEWKYGDYKKLCLAKHVNPLLQRHGTERRGADIAVIVGPTTGPDAVRMAWFALEQAVGLAILAASSVLQHHVPSDRRGEAREAVAAVEAERTALSRLAIARGWAEDPFPGRW